MSVNITKITRVRLTETTTDFYEQDISATQPVMSKLLSFINSHGISTPCLINNVKAPKERKNNSKSREIFKRCDQYKLLPTYNWIRCQSLLALVCECFEHVCA